MIGQIAIATALLGFNDLGRSVTPIFFLETDFIYNYLHCSKMNKKSMWEVKKNFEVSVHRTWNPATLRLEGA